MSIGILKMIIGTLGLIISGILCYMYVKQGVKVKKNKMDMRKVRKNMYMKNEINISKQEMKNFNYDTDYLEEIVAGSKNDTDYLEDDTDFLDDFLR
ncbi:hypothetical protein [uncultured Clostridium sp.]|jgi:cell division protein FtsB|uniref:hypothetical protein n=1 Tax=uncultured Clostridium sp. TaxID=59620 RepID=UPI002601BF2E|nr:hypothetical protein [uncultured Clostridium sp.]